MGHPLRKWANYRKPQGYSWITKDKDRDGAPDIVDCRPNNPNKQGPIWEKVKSGAGKVGGAVSGAVERASARAKAYREAAPERERARLESLKRQAAIERQRAAIESERAKIRRIRESGRKPMSPGLGLGGSSMFGPPPQSAVTQVATKVIKKRKKSRRRQKPKSAKGKRRVVMYV